ncbi:MULTISPECIES: hypothetical protein [unclassified Microcoleus]|uniref:hypothetical protein n=1 Tax=unclassified Microcoleus TaxID=2642155 RepID=UPI001D7B8DC2|nr:MULTISPECIES: hypothetical protein [unclassified Microcoleus]MCC3467776.1 hypothetical protein [Microcoleus sp. PH2017_06_SFM_O_A]MCC3470313.1 hypothetical protein [Microcoleus sp. PH2017_13_LAR_U_A]MCC3548502.1 hypothetical protein [Microcoleus sp. PH2017_24_DOB_U_A]MCC3621126.1 hypothetical protein [Microcoleus sp. PH2017_36_ELK_O_B]
MDSWQWTVDSCIVRESNHLCLTGIGYIHEVIYVLTAVAIAIFAIEQPPSNRFVVRTLVLFPEDFSPHYKISI